MSANRVFLRAGILGTLGGFLLQAPWLKIIDGQTFFLLSSLAVLIAVAVPLGLQFTKYRALSQSIGFSFVVLLLFSLLAVLRNPLGFGSLWHGLEGGFSLLTSIELPAHSPTWALIAPLWLIWIATGVATECLLRARSVVGPAVAWFVAFAVAAAFSSRLGGASAAYGIAFVVVIGGLLLSQPRPMLLRDRDHVRSRGQKLQALGTGPVVLIAVGLLALVVILPTGIIGTSPASATRKPPVVVLRGQNPSLLIATQRYEQQLQNDPLFSATFNAPATQLDLDGKNPGPSQRYLPVAILSNYDGAGWGVSGTFRATNGGNVVQLIKPSRPNTDRDVPTRLDITLKTDELQHFLPFLEATTNVSIENIDGSPDNGMIASLNSLQSGLRYSVESGAQPEAVPPSAFDTQVVSEVIAKYDLEQYRISANAESKSLSSLLNLVTYMRSSGKFKIPSAVTGQDGAKSVDFKSIDYYGQSFQDLMSTVAGPKHNGTPEQFATLFVQEARDLGFPARLVTGYKFSAPSSTTKDVLPSDAWTWAEVYQGQKWKLVDPTPDTVREVPKPNAGTANTGKTPPTQDLNGPVDVIHIHKTTPTVAPPPPDYSTVVLVAGCVVLGVLLLLGGPIAFLSLLRRNRRKKRRTAVTAKDRVVGAWKELIDVSGELGHLHLEAATAEEVVNRVVDRFGDAVEPSAGQLAVLSNVALFSGASTTPEIVATQAWEAVDAYTSASRADLTRGEKFRALLRYRRNR